MNAQPFPMLAAAADLAKLQYPVLGFPKIDGIRAVIHEGKPLSRKLITLPNQFIQGFFSHAYFQGWMASWSWAHPMIRCASSTPPAA